MTGREKFIVTCAAVMAVIGGYYGLLGKKSAPENEKSNSTSNSSDASRINELAESVEKFMITEADLHVISLAEQSWKSNPFLTVVTAEFEDDSAATDAITSLEYKYTGYLQIGDQRVAVIDGVDYQVGNKLEDKDVVVREIHPDHVVLEETKYLDTGEMYPNTTMSYVTVPLVE